jgi:hypothetical protein
VGGSRVHDHPPTAEAIRMNPQDYSRRTVYRPPAGWYRRVNNSLGVLLTSLGLAPRDAVTLEVCGRARKVTCAMPIGCGGYDLR